MKNFKKFEEFVGSSKQIGPSSGSSGCAGPTGSVGYSTHSTTAYSESKLPILEDLELIPINKKLVSFLNNSNGKITLDYRIE